MEVTIKTSYCPTMILFDLPGTVSENTYSAIDNRSSGITMKYLKRKEAQLVIPCESGMGCVAGLGNVIMGSNRQPIENSGPGLNISSYYYYSEVDHSSGTKDTRHRTTKHSHLAGPG